MYKCAACSCGVCSCVGISVFVLGPQGEQRTTPSPYLTALGQVLSLSLQLGWWPAGPRGSLISLLHRVTEHLGLWPVMASFYMDAETWTQVLVYVQQALWPTISTDLFSTSNMEFPVFYLKHGIGFFLASGPQLCLCCWSLWRVVWPGLQPQNTSDRLLSRSLTHFPSPMALL